ncbi:MAG: hypothetical protein ABEJ79_11490 [Halolamina sp.]
MRRPALKPLVRIALTFAVVWFYHALTTGLVGGTLQVVVVVALAVPTWVVLGRVLFPADGDRRLRLPGDDR